MSLQNGDIENDESDNTNADPGPQYPSDDENYVDGDLEFGVRRSRTRTTFSRRDSSSLHPAQFMEVEMYQAAAEHALHHTIVLFHIAALLVGLFHHLSVVIAWRERLETAATEYLDRLRALVSKIKTQVEYIYLLLLWVQSYGEIAMLHAEDLMVFVRPRNHRFKPECYRKVSDISASDCDDWFGLSPHQLRRLFTMWRCPEFFQKKQSSPFSGETCMIIFLYHLKKGVPFTRMARQPFGGDPRYMSTMFDHVVEHLYFTFYNKISGTSLSQSISRHLERCRCLVHGALADTTIFQTEYLNGEEIDQRWIFHHFDYPTSRVFGFIDDFNLRTGRPLDLLRRFGIDFDLQRSFYSGYLKVHGLKAEVLFLPEM